MPAEDVVFQATKRLVIDRTLHEYYENKDDQLRDRLRRRLVATGLDAAGYLALLESGDPAEWSSLESEITINETFFFRFAEQFSCLYDTILPALIEARAHTRRLRIWSAGCSTGAEPYSVAILLHRLLGDALKDWSVSILGTDIDEAALQTARIGDYGDWALRSLSPEERRRDFIPVEGGGNGRRWCLRPAYRSMVRFEKHNLLESLLSSPNGSGVYDLVLCRNVLIYFHQDTVRALVRRFGAALAEDGWLLLGHAEAVGHVGEDLRAVQLDGTVVWRRAVAAAAPQAVPHAPLAATIATPGPRVTRTAGRTRAGNRSPPRESFHADAAVAAPANDPGRHAGPQHGSFPVASAGSETETAIDTVRELADHGRTADALSACRQALEQHPLCAELFFYAALLHRALERDADAETDFRRALYLCKPFVMAHYHLGLLLNDTGRPGPGRRSMAEAARIARDLPADAPLACGDGMTAGRLLALSRVDWSPRDGA